MPLRKPSAPASRRRAAHTKPRWIGCWSAAARISTRPSLARSLAKSALAAQTALGAGQNTVFMTQKIATALFYAQHILPECATEQTRIMHGSRSLLDAAFPE